MSFQAMSLEVCAAAVAANPNCGDAFSYRLRDWCDCVPREVVGPCTPKANNNYNTYRVVRAGGSYLSMREHRAEIVADQPIAAIVPAEVWGEAMADMLAEIKQGHIAEGLAAGVRDVGQVLSEHFPRSEDDENELPDRLIEV